MELYCGDNVVQPLREVTHLKALAKLIILSLAGNPVASLPEYRLHTIYHLSRLKATPLPPALHRVSLSCF